MNAWAKLVQKTYNDNKHKAGYKLKNAMKDAKKVYKTMKKRGGEADKEEHPEHDVMLKEGGKKNKSKKNKSAKKSRKNRK